MQEYILDCGIYVYIGKGLEIKFLNDANNIQYIVIGNAYRVDEYNKTIEESINNYSGNDINKIVEKWTGRWLLIRDNEIQTDAGGLMSVFYTIEKDWIISSSIALICSLLKIKPDKKVSDMGLNWQLLPYTIIPRIRALLCTQKIFLKETGISVVFNPWIKCFETFSTDEKVKIISEFLKKALVNISQYSNKQIWLAITGGKDSRLVLAAAISSKIKFNTYTLEYSNINQCDKNIPKILSRDFSFPHLYIKKEKFSRTKYNDYNRFTAGNSRDADESFYSYGQFENIPENSVVIRSGLFEAGQLYARSISGNTIEGFVSGINNYYQSSFKDDCQTKAFSEWIMYVRQNPIDFIDIRDRMYLEQRVGGWLSAIEQSLCINKFDSVQIANSRIILSILLSANNTEREKLLLSYKTIEYLNKDLLLYPVNKRTLIDKINLVRQVVFSPSRLKRYINRHFNHK